jgi:hypothetical protein
MLGRKCVTSLSKFSGYLVAQRECRLVTMVAVGYKYGPLAHGGDDRCDC